LVPDWYDSYRLIETQKSTAGMSSIGPTASSEVGEILDADIYFNPSDSRTSHATLLALKGTPSAYDMESILTHEMGHSLGFSHSAVWSAVMFPFAPTAGTLVALARRSHNPTLLWEKTIALGCESHTRIHRTLCA
jgi:predicted Zn-dependent protease